MWLTSVCLAGLFLIWKKTETEWNSIFFKEVAADCLLTNIKGQTCIKLVFFEVLFVVFKFSLNQFFIFRFAEKIDIVKLSCSVIVMNVFVWAVGKRDKCVDATRCAVEEWSAQVENVARRSNLADSGHFVRKIVIVIIIFAVRVKTDNLFVNRCYSKGKHAVYEKVGHNSYGPINVLVRMGWNVKQLSRRKHFGIRKSMTMFKLCFTSNLYVHWNIETISYTVIFSLFLHVIRFICLR